MTLLPELRTELVGAMDRGPRRRRPPSLALAGAAIVPAAIITAVLAWPAGSTQTPPADVAATATAVITTTTSGLNSNARPDTPAVSNISGVTGRVQHADPLSGGTIKGLTVSRDGVHADIATNGSNVCSASRTGETPTGSAACGPLPIPADAIPFTIGNDDTRTWVVAIVPDGTTNVTATGTDGQRDIAQITDNVAIAIVPGGDGTIQQLSWRTPDGKTVTQQPGKPGEAPQVTDG